MRTSGPPWSGESTVEAAGRGVVCLEAELRLCLSADAVGPPASYDQLRWSLAVLGDRARSLLARQGDVALAAALTLLTQVEVWTIKASYLEASRLPIAVTTLVMSGSLVWRRRAPVRMAAAVSAAAIAQALVVPTPHPTSAPFVVWMIAAYSVGAHAGLRHAVVGGAMLIVSLDLWAIVQHQGSEFVFLTVILAGFWAVGRIVRSRDLLTAELAARTRELEHEREERTRLAVAEERSRIARELHDIVAHTLGVIVVQAGAERLHLKDGSPMRDAFASIESSGREALEEMGRLLGMLRIDGEASMLAPQPGLSRLDQLLDTIRATGLDVELVVEGSPRPLGAGADVSAYRIVQEALTNTVRHSGSRNARVRLRWETNAIEIEVADDGVGPPAADARNGHGLLGIRERVALYGGILATGRSDLGGFLVSARLPVATE
jgi:signal transduction histidine kinase